MPIFLRAKKTYPFMKRRDKISIFFYVFRKGVLIMLESKFQANLVAELKRRFPGCIVMKNDANYIQGIPDILILYNDMWASLECKKLSLIHISEPTRP